MRFQFRTVLAPGRAAASLAEHGRIVAAMREHLTQVAATLAEVSTANI